MYVRWPELKRSENRRDCGGITAANRREKRGVICGGNDIVWHARRYHFIRRHRRRPRFIGLGGSAAYRGENAAWHLRRRHGRADAVSDEENGLGVSAHIRAVTRSCGVTLAGGGEGSASGEGGASRLPRGISAAILGASTTCV